MNLLKSTLTALIVAGIAGGTYYLTRAGPQDPVADARRGGKAGGGPVAVGVEEARVSDFPLYLEGVGSAKARNSVTVRPQVDGRLISIKFKEGQEVKKGDLLAQIDPVTYQAQLDQASAKKALDESLLENIKRDLVRFEKVGTLALSQKSIDTQRALVQQQEAQIKSDAAAIDNLTAILGYTQIKAPIDGRVGIRNVDEGNLLRAGDSNGIVTITEIRPISVIFTLPQQQLPALTQALSNAALSVEAFTTDSRALLDTGTLQVVDNQVDPQTGTIRIKADFPNAKSQLWPGQFVNIRLLVNTLKGVVIAPTASVQRGPNGPFVFVVGLDDTVSMRPVKVSQQTEKDAVVTEGLTAGERIVTSGGGRLEDGTKVNAGDARKPEPVAAADPMPPASDAKSAPQTNGAPQTTGATGSTGVTAAGANPASPTQSTASQSEPKASADNPAPDNPGKGRHGGRHRDGSGRPGGEPTASGKP